MRGRLPVVGTYTGTGAALSVTSIGFRPKYLKIFNETDGTFIGEVIDGLADDKYYQATNSASTQFSVVGSGGITLGSTGFSVGTAAGINTAAKVYRYVAF